MSSSYASGGRVSIVSGASESGASGDVQIQRDSGTAFWKWKFLLQAQYLLKLKLKCSSGSIRIRQVILTSIAGSVFQRYVSF